MAKVISDEILKLKIVINGDEAQKRVLDLERANNTLANSINELSQKNKDLAKNRKLNSVEIENNKKEIQRLNDVIGENLKKIDDEVKEMNILSLTTDQLNKRIKDLSFSMRHMDPNSPGYKAAGDEMSKLTNRLREVKTGTTQSAFSLQHLSDKFNQYSGIATAAIATLAGVAFSIQSVIDANNKMADAQTAVSKTTGLNTEQVRELTAAFTEFDTRTSKIDLLKIAEIGGRLGVPKEEIKNFTREIDKAYVALGDSFTGGVDAVATKLGKLKGLFKETKDENISEAFNQIGSALNELGAAGSASEENMSDFALRIGQLPEALKPTIAETLALGGAFEESGIIAERASSGYSKFVRVAATETEEFSKVMHISQKEVKDLINQDPLQFFLKFAKGAKGLDAVKLSEVLDGLKLNDAEVISVIGAASENTDRFRKSIELSNQALTDATSLQEEFDKVNNNSAAIYDKVQKKFVGMFTSQKVAETLNWLITIIGKLLGVVEDSSGKITGFKNNLMGFIKIVTLAVVAVVSYNAALAFTNLTMEEMRAKLLSISIIQKINNTINSIAAGIQTIYNTVIGYTILGLGKLFRSTTLQTAAQERLNLVTRLNGFAVFVSILAVAATALYFLKQRTDEAKEAARKHAEEINRFSTIQKEINESGAQAVKEYKENADKLIDVLKSELSTQGERKKAYEALIKIHPEFMGTVDREYRATAKLAEIYGELAFKIELKAKAQARASARQSIYDDIETKRIEMIRNQSKVEEEQEKRNEVRRKNKEKDQLSQTVIGGSTLALPQSYNKESLDFTENNKQVALLNGLNSSTQLLKKLDAADQARINELRKLIAKSKGKEKEKLEQELYSYYGESNSDPEATSNYTPLADKEKKKKKTDEEKEQDALNKLRDKWLSEELSYQQKLGELQEDSERNRIELMKDGFEKEKALILLNQQDKVSDLEAKKVSNSDLLKIDDMIAKEQNSSIKKHLEAIRFTWKKENDEYTALQLQEKEIAALKIKALEEKYQNIAFQKIQADFDKKQKLLDREMNNKMSGDINSHKEFLADQGYTPETLAGITSWEESRAMIEKFYKEKRLREQIDYLKTLIAEMSVLQAMSPIDFTPEQQARLEAAKDSLAAIGVELASMTNGGNKSNLGSKLASFGGQKDILGLTPDQWDSMINNTDKTATAIQRVGAAIQVAQNMMAMYSEFASANEAKLLQQYETASQRKQTRLDKQLKAGLITQEQYKKATLKNEKELDLKKAQIAYKAAKREKAMNIASAIANTALGIIQAWVKPGYPMAIPMSIIIGALGALQVATIASQPLPDATGAEDGFYPTIRKQDGKLFNARKRTQKTGVYSEPTMLVGEQGAGYPELVVTSKTARQIDPDVSNAYMREIARVEGFQDGYYKNVKNTPSKDSGSDDIMIKLISSIDSFNETMRGIKDEGLDARIGDSFSNGEKIDKMVKGYQNLYNNSKHG